MRRVIAIMVALALVFTTAAKCPDEQGGKHRQSSQADKRNALPRTTVVSVSWSSTAPGFSWEIKIAGSKGRNRPMNGPGYENTRDHSERIEIVEGQDVLFTAIIKGWSGAVVQCRLTTSGGLQKKHQIATKDAVCAQNVPALFDANEYD